jgi:hypothetical protein
MKTFKELFTALGLKDYHGLNINRTINEMRNGPAEGFEAIKTKNPRKFINLNSTKIDDHQDPIMHSE